MKPALLFLFFIRWNANGRKFGLPDCLRCCCSMSPFWLDKFTVNRWRTMCVYFYAANRDGRKV